MSQLTFWEMDTVQPARKERRRNFLHTQELEWDTDLYRDIEDFCLTSNAQDLCY